MKYEVLTKGASDSQLVECQSVVDRNGFVDFLRVGGTSDWIIVLRVHNDSMLTMRLLPEKAVPPAVESNGGPAPAASPDHAPA